MASRREFLIRAGATAIGFGALRLIPGCETIDVEPKVKGSAFDFITDEEDWYYQSGHGTAEEETDSIAPSRDDWSLRMTDPDGEVATLDFDRLQSMEEEGRSITYIKTMQCVLRLGQVGAISNTFVSTGVFTGIPLPEVFSDFDVPVDSTAKLRTYGADGFTSNLTVERAAQPGPDPLPAMLAYEMNGRPLSSARGGPVRLIIPEMWGYKNMKWVERLHFTEDEAPFGGYERLPGDDEGTFEDHPAQEIIDKPGEIALTDFVTRPGNRGVEFEDSDVTIRGATVVGGAAVDDVEVSLSRRDEAGSNEFESVDLISQSDVLASENLSADAREALERAVNFGDTWPAESVWRIWSKSFEGLAPGPYELTVRSTDSTGRVTDEREPGPVESKKVEKQVSVPFSVVSS